MEVVPTGWLIFLALVNLYILLIWWLVRTRRMEKWNLSLMLGFILMVRTQRGKKTLEFLSRPTRLWSLFGDFGIILALVGMAAMTFFMLILIPIVLDPGSGIEPLAASEILVIPGVNPFVPLWYGIIALIVTLVVHEGGHGVLALAHKMRVKSLGLLFAIVPIGAFVEPDEEDLMASSRRKRLQVYAAGPTVNIVVAALLLAGFAGAIAAADPVEGTAVASVTLDAPAEQAGLEPGDVIVEADGRSIPGWETFRAFMDEKRPGDAVTFTLRDGSSATATLTSRWSVLDQEARDAIFAEEPAAMAYCRQVLDPDPASGGACAEQLQDDAFLGIAPFQPHVVQGVLAGPVDHVTNFLFIIALPIGEVRGEPYLSFYLPAFFETPFAEEAYWPMVNILFWVFWINLMVGLTNILPMLPLDGGHIFRDAAGGVVGRLRPKMDPQRRDRIVGRAAATISLIIFGAFLLQIFGPRLAMAFS